MYNNEHTASNQPVMKTELVVGVYNILGVRGGGVLLGEDVLPLVLGGGGRGGATSAVLGLGVCKDVALEVGALRKLLVARVEGADIGTVSCVDAHVRPQVEVQ